MKKYIFYSLCLLLLWSGQFVAAQSLRPVARQISTLKESGALPKVAPFSPYTATPPDVSAMVSQATFLQLNQVALEDLLQQSPYGLELTLPTATGKPLVLELFRANPLAEEFISTERTAYGERNVSYKAGLYYRGIVKGNDNSMAAISFFANGQVIGVMATAEDGNMVLGNVGNSKALVFYYEKDLLIKNNFDCGSDDDTFGQGGAFPLLPAFEKSADCEAAICKTINIYFECDNQMYLDNGSNTTNVNNYVSGFFNAVATIYQNDNMTIAISEIYVWTTADTYPSTGSSEVLNQFSSNVSTFNGDLAHLLSTENNGHGGVAWLDALCGDVYYRHAYSNISNSYQNFPTYSWTVMVVAHETGHNVASPHTQNCCWPGGAIDNCYTTEACGTTTCSGGPAPTNGGTVMSYCHLTSYGINLNNGFGVLPGTLMRNRVCAVSCLNTTGAIAIANFTYTFSDLTVSLINTSTNATSFNWNFGDGNTSTDASPTHTYTANGTYTVILETCTTDCGCSTKSSTITVATGTSGNGPCSGNLPLTACTGTITDGSGSANYGDMWNCSWAIQTDPGTVITLTFTAFDTEASYDFVRVYNGIDASAPLLGSYSGTSLPPTLVSSSNQMYITFASDPYVTATGWSANYACSSAGYCTLQGTDATYEWIDSLQIAAIQNASGSNGGYGDFTSISDTLVIGDTYSFYFKPAFFGGTWAENWRMWIDYNSNYTFDDSGELVFEQAIPTTNNVSGSFTVPANLTDNSTRLRVAMSYDILSPSCGIFNYGEVEDYSIYLRSYCSSLGQTVTDEWIGGVEIGDFSNTSGVNDGYVFFDNLAVSLEQGATYPLTLTPQFSGQTWPEYWTIYIDYNHDGDFSDSGELAYSSGGTSNTAVSGTLTVPAATIIGSTRLRVVMRYNTQGAACGTYNYGETEDYIAIISAPTQLCPTTATLSDALGTQAFTQQVSDYIIANNTVSGTAAVIYDAANYIDLTDGFWAQDSCDFTAMIAGCAPAANKPAPATVAVKNEQAATGIAATKEPTPLMLEVFPNPSRGNSTLRFSAEEEGKRVVIELYNIQGKIVQRLYEGSAASTMQEVPINTAQLPAGLYWIRMQNETGTSEVIKLAVQ